MVAEEQRFPTKEAACRACADFISHHLREGITARGHASAALSGGRTAATVFDSLARADLDWTRVTLTLIDDRWVPIDHADSNEGLVKRYLPDVPFVSLKTPDAEPKHGLDAVATRLAEAFPGPFDCVYLGMGADGHIASLFPDDPTWEGKVGPDEPSVHAVAAINDRQPRISLMPARLFKARSLVLLSGGADKLAAWERAKGEGPIAQLPVRLALKEPMTALLYD
ncbi:MAG: 6-phosphogluconolactonase [Magnetovibrionaceae bacterium]